MKKLLSLICHICCMYYSFVLRLLTLLIVGLPVKIFMWLNILIFIFVVSSIVFKLKKAFSIRKVNKYSLPSSFDGLVFYIYFLIHLEFTLVYGNGWVFLNNYFFPNRKLIFPELLFLSSLICVFYRILKFCINLGLVLAFLVC